MCQGEKLGTRSSRRRQQNKGSKVCVSCFFWSGFEVWDLAFKLAVSGLLLGRFRYVILLRKPNYSLYTHNLVTSIRNLTSNPVFCGCLAEGLGASGVFGFAVGI